MTLWVGLTVAFNYLLAAVLAGGIAYLGNHLGRQIGKKRMSVLGMRPRHTSNFITVVTGSLIAVVTLTLAAALSKDVRALLSGIDDARRELAQLQLEVQQLKEQRDRLRVVWGAGQPIALWTLEPGVPLQAQRVRILGALNYANTLSIQANNRIAKERRDPFLDTSEQLLEWDEQRLDQLARTMLSSTEVVGLRIVAERNAAYRDKVPVRLETMPVSLVFRQGEVVAARKLQPKDPELLLDWYAFTAEIRETALSRGMIEVNDSFGGLDAQDLERLIKDIKRLQGPGKLVAIAQYDLYQTSLLAVRIEVRPERTAHRSRGLAARGRR